MTVPRAAKRPAKNPARSRRPSPAPTKALRKAALRDIVERVVRAAKPAKLILFGSAVRGQMGPDSDVDLLVVKGGRFDRGRLTEQIYESLFGASEAVDVIVVTPEELVRYRDTPGLVIQTALAEGKVIYAA